MLHQLQSIILMGQPQPGQEANPLMTYGPLVLIIVVFYFFMIRPQVKKQKEMKTFREALKKGDKVVTLGGIYGKINDIKDNTVSLEIAPNTVIKIDKSALNSDTSELLSQPAK